MQDHSLGNVSIIFYPPNFSSIYIHDWRTPQTTLKYVAEMKQVF